MEWDYNIEDDIETLHTDGPLHDPVIVLVCGILGSLFSWISYNFFSTLSENTFTLYIEYLVGCVFF